jgi:hypothetical protein
MNCSQQQQQRSSSLSSRRISSSSKRSIGVSLNRRKQNSSSSSRKETVVVSASSAKIKVVGCGGGNAVNRMIEAGVSVSLCVERIALRSCFLHKALALSTTTIRNRRNCLRTSLSLSLSHSSRAFFTLVIDRSSTCCCFCVARRCSASIYRRDLTV